MSKTVLVTISLLLVAVGAVNGLIGFTSVKPGLYLLAVFFALLGASGLIIAGGWEESPKEP